MTLINVDINNPDALERPAYEPLETGQYDMEIINKPEATPTKNPSSDGVNYGKVEVQLRELESEKTVTDYISLHPKMLWKLGRLCKSAGIAEVEPGKIDLADLEGRVVRAAIQQRTYTRQDGTQGIGNEVDNYLWEE